jgi:hypothetical protein
VVRGVWVERGEGGGFTVVEGDVGENMIERGGFVGPFYEFFSDPRFADSVFSFGDGVVGEIGLPCKQSEGV